MSDWEVAPEPAPTESTGSDWTVAPEEHQPRSFLDKAKHFVVGDQPWSSAPSQAAGAIKDFAVGTAKSLKSANDYATSLLFHPVDTVRPIVENPGAAYREGMRGINSNIPFANRAVESVGGPAAESAEDSAAVPGLRNFAGVAAAPGVGKMVGGIAAKGVEAAVPLAKDVAAVSKDAATGVKSYVAKQAKDIDRAVGEKAVSASVKPTMAATGAKVGRAIGATAGGIKGFLTHGVEGGGVGTYVGGKAGEKVGSTMGELAQKLTQSIAGRHLRNLAAEAEPGIIDEVAGKYAARTVEPSFPIPTELELNPVTAEATRSASPSPIREPHPVPENPELNPVEAEEPRAFKGDEPPRGAHSKPAKESAPAPEIGRPTNKRPDVSLDELKVMRDRAKSPEVRAKLDEAIQGLGGGSAPVPAGTAVTDAGPKKLAPLREKARADVARTDPNAVDEFGVPVEGPHYKDELSSLRRKGGDILVKLDELSANGVDKVPPELQKQADEIMGKISGLEKTDIAPRRIVKGEMLPETAARKQRGATKEQLAHRERRFGGSNTFELDPRASDYKQRVAKVAELAHALPTPMFVKIAQKAGLSAEQAESISLAAKRRIVR